MDFEKIIRAMVLFYVGFALAAGGALVLGILALLYFATK